MLNERVMPTLALKNKYGMPRAFYGDIFLLPIIEKLS